MATALTRPRRPLLPMPALRREMDRLFGDFFPAAPWHEDDEEARRSAVWTPRMDFSETEREYFVKLDLPGLQKEDITVHVEDHRLTVSGQRQEEKKEEDESFLRVERSYGSFYRALALPKAAKEEAVAAAFENGVLTIRIPKAEEAKPHRVQIA